MIDFYKKNVLSQFGKQAVNKNMLDYVKNIEDKYNNLLLQVKEQKSKVTVN